MSTGPTTFVQSKTTILFREPEQPTMKNGNRSPEFPDSQFRPGTWFRHTTVLTPKLAKKLNHAISGPQVSFVVAKWRLGMPPRVSNFANTT